jgi:hypothetical protein
MPSPPSGRKVAAFCLVLPALGFVGLAKTRFQIDWNVLSTWVVLFFSLLPPIHYGLFIWKRLDRFEGVLMFVNAPLTPGEIKVPMAAYGLVVFIGWLINTFLSLI